MKGLKPHERNMIISFENRAKILSAFQTHSSYSEVLEVVGLSDATVSKHIKKMKEEGLLKQNKRKYSISENGLKELGNLREEVSKFTPFLQKKINPNLFRHTVKLRRGALGSARYTGFLEVWAEKPENVDKKVIDDVAKAMVSMLPKGIETTKLTITIGFQNAEL